MRGCGGNAYCAGEANDEIKMIVRSKKITKFGVHIIIIIEILIYYKKCNIRRENA